MKKIIALVLVLLLAAALLTACAAGGDDGKYNRGNAEIKDAVENLKIDWTAGKVTIAYHNENTILVEEKSSRTLSEDEKLRWKVEGKSLEILYQKPGLVNFSLNLEKELTVTLPEGIVLDKADLESTSGDIFVPEMKAKSLVLHSTSGDIDATAEAETVRGSMTSGDLKLTLTGHQTNVDLDSTSGSVNCVLSTADSVKIGSTSGGAGLQAGEVKKAELGTTSGAVVAAVKTFDEIIIGATSGTVDLTLPAEPGFTAELASTSGDVSTDLMMAVSGTTYSCGDGSGKVKASTTSGNIRIHEMK